MLKEILKNQSGQSLLIASFFLFLVLAFSLILVSSIFSNNQESQRLYYSSIASNLAEAGIEKAIWCLNQSANNGCGGTFGPNYLGESNVSLGAGKFSTTVTGSGSSRTIVSLGVGPKNVSKKIAVTVSAVPTSSGISFSYALQAGAGTVTIQNSATVDGSIYSNSSILCTSDSSSLIKGDATVAGSANQIQKCKINYDAAVHYLNGSTIGRDAYYTTIANGTTVAGTKYPGSPDPQPTTLPSFDLNLWENLAQNGGTINGDYAPANGSSLGPKKINGNLHFNNNVTVTITGPVWVTGNITIDQGATLVLDPGFGDNGTLIIADNVTDLVNYGKIVVSNGANVLGSSSKSFILFLATNNSTDYTNPAININNTAEGAIFSSPNGLIRLRNNANVKSLSAYALYLDQNAEVNYEQSELIDLNFAAGPGGNWQLQKSSWQDLSL